MKRSPLVLAGFILGTITLTLQMGLIVPEGHVRASTPATPSLLEAAASKPKRFLIAFVLQPMQRQGMITAPSPIVKPSAPPTLNAIPPNPLTASLLPQQSIPAILDQPDIHEADKLKLAPVLDSLAPDCLAKLQDFYVVYNHSLKSRGYAGRGTVMLDGTVPEEEQVALHEVLGHYQGLTCMRGTPGSTPSAFKDGNAPIPADSSLVAFYQISWLSGGVQRSDAKPADFVSGYASSNEEEDRAESVAMYLSQRSAFETMAQTDPAIAKKLAWMRQYLPQQQPILQGTYVAQGDQRPWDVTKLPVQ